MAPNHNTNPLSLYKMTIFHLRTVKKNIKHISYHLKSTKIGTDKKKTSINRKTKKSLIKQKKNKTTKKSKEKLKNK